MARLSPLSGLSVVILNYNTCALLERCVATLLARGLAPEQIVVVDNASQDGSAAWLRTQAPAGLGALLLEENVGFAAGNNAGIAHTAGAYVLLLNTDAFPEPGCLETLLGYMERNPQVAVASPQLLFEGGRWQRCSGAVPSPRQAMLEAFGLPSLARALRGIAWPLVRPIAGARRVGYVDGACMVIRRRVLEEIGLLDAGYFFFVEDAEFCDRARRHGYTVALVGAARAVHLRGGSSARKDRAASERMKRDALRRFVTQQHGEAGWRRYARWTARNFRWRARLCALAGAAGLGSRARCAAYQESARIYAAVNGAAAAEEGSPG